MIIIELQTKHQLLRMLKCDIKEVKTGRFHDVIVDSFNSLLSLSLLLALSSKLPIGILLE